MATNARKGEKNMEKIEVFNSRDYADMLEARCKIETGIRKTYKNASDASIKSFIRNRDIQDALCQEIANEFVYGGYSSNPIIQKMTEMVAGDDPDFDDDTWNYNWSLIYKLAEAHLSCLFHGMMIEYNIDFVNIYGDDQTDYS